MTTSLTSGIPRRETCLYVAAPPAGASAAALCQHGQRGPARGGPDAQHRFAALLKPADGHLDHKAVDVVAGQRIDGNVVLLVTDGRFLPTQGQKIEHLQVDKEGVIGLPGKHLDAAGSVVEGLCFERGIVLGRLLADVDRGARLVGHQHRNRAVGGRLRYRIVLLAVPVGVAHAADRTGVVQEGVRVADLHLARQGVRIVGRGVAVVVHIDVVEDTVIPLIVVRTTLRPLQRNPAGQQDESILIGRRQKRIRVGVVGVRVFRDQGRLAMARGFGMAGKSDQYAADQECSRGCHACREANSAFPSVVGLHTTFSFSLLPG